MKHHSKITAIASIAATSMPDPALDVADHARPEKPLNRLAWQKPSVPERPGPVRSLLGLLGHSAECAGLAMQGQIVSCGCRTRPMDDPAVAVGLVMHCARIAMTRRLPIPAAVTALLAQRVEEGDAACAMVAEWLEASGLPGTACEKSDATGRAR